MGFHQAGREEGRGRGGEKEVIQMQKEKIKLERNRDKRIRISRLRRSVFRCERRLLPPRTGKAREHVRNKAER